MQLLKSQSGSHSRNRKWKRHRKLYTLAAVLIVAVMVFGGSKAWKAAKPRYHQWKQDRALKQAEQFIKQREPQKAQLALEVALKEVPGNPDAIRLAADMLEQAGSPQAMRLRRAVVRVLPGSADDRAKLVISCIRFRDFNAAKDALASTSPEMSAELPMLRAALSYALSTNDTPVADALFIELKNRLPADVELRHGHALLRLQHPEAKRRKEAEDELEAIARDHANLRLQIEQELAGYATKQMKYAEAKVHYQSILEKPNASFPDRLKKANIDLLIDGMPFEDVFAELAPAAAGNEADVMQFAQWLVVQDRAQAADTWIMGLPESLRNSAMVKSVHADVVVKLKDWDRLNIMLKAGAWGPVMDDTLRLAMSALTFDTPDRAALRHEVWNMALSSAGTHLASLRILQILANAWGWDVEKERTLWVIARMFPDQTQTHQALFNLYRSRKDTKRMRDVMEVLRDSDPAVLRYQHDWALLSLLTENNANWTSAKETMSKLYQTDSSSAVYATGYGLALAQSGREAEALAVIQKFTPAERDYPPRQPYLALIYGVARRPEDLARARSLAKDLDLLPEEAALFTRAESELTREVKKPAPDKTAKPSTASPLGHDK